jgi:hypothetical protein
MITINVGFEFGGYTTAYAVELACWPVWPIDANVVVKWTGLGFELKVTFEVEGFKMEFTVVTL